MQIADLSWGASEMSSANDISLSHREASTSTNQLLELYCHNNLAVKFENLISQLSPEKMGFYPNIDTFCIYLDFLGRNGKVDFAEKTFKNITAQANFDLNNIFLINYFS